MNFSLIPPVLGTYSALKRSTGLTRAAFSTWKLVVGIEKMLCLEDRHAGPDMEKESPMRLMPLSVRFLMRFRQAMVKWLFNLVRLL